MKLAIVIFSIFFLSIAMRTEARELNFKERTILLNYDKTKNVSEFMVNHINPNDLAISDYIRYQVLKNSCTPLETKLIDIRNASSELKNQSKKLKDLMDVCSQATVGLTALYLDHK